MEYLFVEPLDGSSERAGCHEEILPDHRPPPRRRRRRSGRLLDDARAGGDLDDLLAASPAGVRAGFRDLSQFYFADAHQHFERAVELDPDFAIVKLHLAFLSDTPERERLREELGLADRDRLNAQERFLLADWLGREDPEADREALLAEFLERHPDCAPAATSTGRPRAGIRREECYQRLLELHPNWVQAQNRLGYIAMARGCFSEAEQRFRSYRFIAPDQANPYDSMAELLTLLGRYQEAEAALAEAIRIKPDFCHAYELQAQIGLFSMNLDRVEEAVQGLESFPACERWQDDGYPCSIRGVARYLGGDAKGAWQAIDGECLERRNGFDLFGHRAAVMTGRLERAAEMEEILRKRRQRAVDNGRPVAADHYDALLAHMEGVRALAGKDFAAAAERLAAADELMGYWGGDRASFKLLNRLNLLRALELVGEDARAKALRRKIEAVNPRLLDDHMLSDLDALGAG